jgi:DeoR/GlpR family transcriptional regulator of sugar metabolism
MRMNVSERRAQLRGELLHGGEVTIPDLAERYLVSEMTIRRDLEALEDEGVARRVRNGAIRVAPRSFEPEFENRADEARWAKAAIGERAASLVDDGETVVIDSGTTALALARSLRGRGHGLTVVTPGVLAAIELAADPKIKVMLPGGMLRPKELSMIGPSAEDFFGEYNCDVFFTSAAGLDIERGLTDYSLDEARVKKAAIKCARRVIALIDQTKFDKVYFANITPLDSIDVLVTDAAPDHAIVRRAEALGIEVLCVETQDFSDQLAIRTPDRSA